jgi:hypothetical protein
MWHLAAGAGVSITTTAGARRSISRSTIAVWRCSVLKETNFTPKPAGSNVAANYVTGQTTEIGPGLSMRARTLVPFGRVVGFEVGLFGNISGFQSLFGVDMALVFGVLRARRST